MTLAPASVERASADEPRLVGLYDRDCAFCAWTARQLWSIDRYRRLSFLPLQEASTAGAAVVARAVEGRSLSDALHVVDERDGRLAGGGDALLAILDVLPGGRWFRAWAALPPIRVLVDLGYRLAAANRVRLGEWLGLDASRCVVPAGGGRSGEVARVRSLG